MKMNDPLNYELLVQYVLGELDMAQENRIEQLRTSNPEVADMLNEIELQLEKIGLDNAISPPKNLKLSLLAKLDTDGVKTLQLKSEVKNNRKFWLGIAASFAAFFLLGSIYLFSELKNIKQDLEITKKDNNKLIEELKAVTSNFNETNKWYLALSNPETEQYILKGNALAPNARIVSFVNHDTKSVIINTKKLPQIDELHDYQMWADVDGEMINMGIIPKDRQLTAMTYIDNAESLNITIEPAGGKDHPTVERLISNVYLH